MFGAGISAVSIAVLAAAYQGLSPAQVPHASGATRILMQIGGSIGTAVIAIILSGQVAAQVTSGVSGLSDAFNNTFWWPFGFTLVGLVPALILPSRARKAGASKAEGSFGPFPPTGVE